uniref:Uncharacterized protein n=1 Tax=Triticum urartu TaxID=4572 RepID=A0A8R7PZC0_TRIUA
MYGLALTSCGFFCSSYFSYMPQLILRRILRSSFVLYCFEGESHSSDFALLS